MEHFPISDEKVTYKHLHSTSPNVLLHSPLRVIAHCDLDAAYAQFERKRLGLTMDDPIVVQQWQGLIAISYPARKFGVTRHENIEEARKKCPGLVAVHVATYREGDKEAGYWDDMVPDPAKHKVSLDVYRREGLKVVQMLRNHFPTAEVEKASIDEAFIDLSIPVRNVMLEKYPYLGVVPDDLPDYIGMDSPLPPAPDLAWNEDTHGYLIPSSDDSDEPSTWPNIALAIGAELMQIGRKAMWDELQYTSSSGLSRNKIMAKLCSSWRKPNQQSTLRTSAMKDFLGSMEFRKIRMLGGKLGDSVAKDFEASTVGQLWHISEQDFTTKYGESGAWLWKVIRGINFDEVKEKIDNKSMLASKNMRTPPTSEGFAGWLRVLSSELGIRLNEARGTRNSVWPKTLHLSIRFGYDTFKSKQHPFPQSMQNSLSEHIYRHAEAISAELLEMDREKSLSKITNISLAFHGLEALEQGQKNIKGYFLSASSVSSKEHLPISKNRELAERKVITITDSSDDDVILCKSEPTKFSQDVHSFVADDMARKRKRR